MFVPYYVKANEKITIELETYPKMDIVLTSKDTNLDLTNFEQDIKNELSNRGVNTNNVNVQAVETTIVDTNATDAQTIFNTWTRFPYNKASNWIYDSSGKYLTSSVNEPYETGFIDQSLGYVQDVTLSASLNTTEYTQPMGYIVRMQPQKTNANRYNMYMLWISGWDGYNYTSPNFSSTAASGKTYYTTPKRSIVLFKVEGLILDYNIWKNYQTGGTYAATPLCQAMYAGVNCLGWPYHGPRAYGGYPDGTKLINGTTVTNVGDSGLKTTTLGWANLELGNNATFNMTLDVHNDTFKAYYNDNLLFTAKDDSYDSGYYGVFQFSHVTPKFYGISANIHNYKNFNDLLRASQWRDDASHFVVNVGNKIDNSFVDVSKKGEILTRTINDNINFIHWGSNENKNTMENFIKENNNNGVYFDGSNYEEVLQNTVDYIVSLYAQENDNQYVIVDTPTNLVVSPENLATNTSDSEYPNGKWIIHHNAKYFANETGQSEYSEQYQDDLNIIFDKPGQYDIYYGEDLVKTIYAHRKPIANFTMNLNSDKTLNLVNQSYDLDSDVDTYSLGKGIKEIEWQWKNLNDSEWTLGKPTFALVDGESYVIQLIVTDEQNVSSSYTSKFVTLNNSVQVQPVAYFNLENSTIYSNKELEIINTSYDPKGLSIIAQEWTLKKGNTTISTSATPTTIFTASNLGVGEYTYILRVKNSNNLWSEPYTKSFSVVEDKTPPSVMIEPTYSDWGNSSAINFEFMDNGSGFAKFRYTHSSTQTPPNDNDAKWSEWLTSDNGSLTIQEDGVWYLHLQAYDNNNNSLNRTVGVYRIDTTKPIIDSIIVDESSIEREIPIVVNAHDETSGIEYYRFVNETSGEDSGYIETNTYNAKSNGVFTIYVKDKNNNETSTLSKEITIIDREAPNVVTLKIDTNTNKWSTNVETTIKAEDTFAGMNTYSYSLEKVDENGLKLTKKEDNNDNPFLLNVYAEENITYSPLIIDMDTFDVNAYTWQENDTFNINENGTYNLYARDNANNVSGIQFTIGNIDTTAPTIEKIEKSNNEVTNQDITITIIGANDDQAGLHEKPYSYDNGNTWTSNNTYVVTNNTNGEVNVLVRDAIENIATFTYSIDNIDKTLPSFEDLNISNNREEKKSTITFSFSDDRELYGYVLKTNSSLPQDSEYITNFEIDNGIVTSEYEVNRNGIYYLFIKDKAGNIYPQKLQIDALVTGIDFSQNKVTEYQTIGEESNISLYNTRNQITNEGDFDTYVYVSQQSTFSVVVPKVLVLDGQTGYADYQVSVLGNIAGKETIGIIPNDTFEMKDSDGVKANIVANVSQGQTSFAYDEIVNKTTTNGSISASTITAGRWNGILNFNVLVQNNLNIKDSIASVSEDSFSLQVDDSAITLK